MELYYLYYDEEIHNDIKNIIGKYKDGLMMMYTDKGKLAFFDQDMYESMKEDLDELNIGYSE